VYGTSTLLSPLARRWRRSARLRRRALRGALALGALLLIALPPGSERIWHDVGLTLLVFAFTLPVWRAPEESLPDVLRLRELHRRICWRTSTGLVLAGTLALVANRWLLGRHTAGDTADAHTVAVWGVLLACLGAVPSLAENLLWRLWPGSVRRAAKIAEAMAKINRIRSAVRPVGPIGPPEPIQHQPAGPPSAGACATPAPRQPNRKHIVLRWDGHHLSVSDGLGATHPIPVAGRDGDERPVHAPTLRPIGEIVWLSHVLPGTANISGGTLLLIDAEGRRRGTLTGLPFRQADAAWVARHAGIAFTAYDLTFASRSYGELVNALYPRRGRAFELDG
jgi:hypothetical protein